jgi:hypothetical protein
LIYSPSDRAVLTRRARDNALKVEFLRAVYGGVQRRLGNAALGRVALGDLMRDVQADNSKVRVALNMLEEAGLLRRHQDIPRTAVVLLRGGHRPEAEAWSAFTAAARLKPGQPLALDPAGVAASAGLDLTTLETHLMGWADAGWLDYRPSGRELLLELLPPPSDAAVRINTLIDGYTAIQAQRVDEIAAYAGTRHCRHGHISAYLTGRGLKTCGACDNCHPKSSPITKALDALDLPDEREQLQLILRCIGQTSYGWGPANLTYTLQGNTRASEYGRASPYWGALAFRSKSAIDALVERLIDASLLTARQLHHGGTVLGLTAAGSEALDDPAKFASLASKPAVRVGHKRKRAPDAAASPAPDESSDPVDEALFERLREWRLATAQTAGLPPYVIAHDSLLRRIAAQRPEDPAALSQIKGVGPKTLEKYGAAILAVVREESP